MVFAGIQKSSLVDFPGEVADVVFTLGCNFRCPYCHNSHALNKKSAGLSVDEVLVMLSGRRKYIDAVVVSGGEPTIWGDELLNFFLRIKDLGFKTKLDTNGTNPELVKRLILCGLLDYVAMDVKAPLVKYEKVVNARVNKGSIISSVRLLKKAGISHEFRVTVCNELLDREDIKKILRFVPKGSPVYLQNFRDGDTVLAGKGCLSTVDFLDEFKDELHNIKVR